MYVRIGEAALGMLFEDGVGANLTTLIPSGYDRILEFIIFTLWFN